MHSFKLYEQIGARDQFSIMNIVGEGEGGEVNTLKWQRCFRTSSYCAVRIFFHVLYMQRQSMKIATANNILLVLVKFRSGQHDLIRSLKTATLKAVFPCCSHYAKANSPRLFSNVPFLS